jgi:hypothetical protein
MTGTVTVLTPINNGNAVELGRRLFRKQLLPKTKIDYKGRELDFDDAYLDSLAEAFADQAFDTCPLVMAPSDNSHTMDPRAATGEIIGVERTADGLDILVAASDEAAKVLSENPKVGVSARIVEELSRADGKSFRAAIQHALITYAPRIPNLRPWEAVECSQETDAVLDLSALVFTPDGVTDQEKPSTEGTTKKEEGTPVPEITDEQAAAILKRLTPSMLLDLLKTEGKPGSAPESKADEDKKDEPKTEDKPVAPVVKLEPKPKAPEPKVPAVVAASDDEDDNKHLDLALVEMRTRTDRQAIELAELKAERDAEKWRYEREQLVRDYGLPPAVVALAEPLLKAGKRSVELSDGTSVDAAEVVRSVLHTVAKTYGKAVDLSGPLGTAHDHSEGADDAAAAGRQRILDWATARNFGK